MMFFRKSKTKKLEIGDAAPDFLLTSQSGELIALNDLKGKMGVVLYFYPKDDTYNCAVESSEFRDHFETFKEAGVEIIGISSDTPASHKKFANKYKLPFPLLSDRDNKVRELFGVPNTMGLIPGRVTYVLDKKGTVLHIINSQFDPKSHVARSLDVIKGLNTS